MRLLHIVVVCCLCSNGLYAAPNDALQINVLSGDNVVVPAASGRAANIRVRVTDRASKPVEGALVSAILPPSASAGISAADPPSRQRKPTPTGTSNSPA